MAKSRRWIAALLIGSLAVLAGCAEETAKEEKLEQKVSELESQLQKEKEKQEQEKREQEKQAEEEKEPAVVQVIDPNTKAVIKTFKPEEMGFEKDQEKYKQQISLWAKQLARGTDASVGYDKRMVPDRIDANGQIVKGNPRTILEESELTSKVIEASADGGSVELPLIVSESGYKPEEAAHLSEVVVASYTTNFNSSVAGRTKNIELSAQAIQNVIVGIGDYFSFNTTVGPSDEAHGYQPAQEAINGKLVMGIGGGICQTSSTLFNAVDQIGVEYVEKHHHSVTVGYVPVGRDATVSYGGKDFRFQNKTGAPFLLKTLMENGKLTVEVRTSKQYADMIKKKI
jgi:vancomycin resistance protein YoaR